MAENVENPGELERFKHKANEFARAFETLLAHDESEIPDKLKPEYQNLVQKGGIIKTAVENTASTYDFLSDLTSTIYGYGESAGEWVGGAWDDLTGWLQGSDNDTLRGLGNLGAVFSIPVILGMSGIAALSWFISSTYQFERKLAQAKRLQESGDISDQQFLDVFQGDSWLPNFQGALPWIALAAGAYFLLRGR